MNYGYLRVSTDQQDNDKFKSTLLNYCNDKNLGKISFIEEKVTGKKDWRDRELGKLIDIMQSGDVLIVPELSRLARSISQIYQIIDILKSKNIGLHIIKQSIIINGSMTMQDKMFISMLSLFSELERDFISQRTKEGLQARKDKGVILGRTLGSGLKLEGKEAQIKEYLALSMNTSQIARLLNVTRITMTKFIKDKKLKAQ